MGERPILFSGEMVRAILDGRKTQTRRVVRFRDPGWVMTELGDGRLWPHEYERPRRTHARPALCPYGSPGDRLWVRETFALSLFWEENSPSSVPCDSPRDIPVWWAADGPVEESINRGRWRPSIHMPRWASRITLEVTGVRVERLQDISEEDARAEGVETRCLAEPDESPECSVGWRNPDGFALDNFRTLWASINGADSWDANPWVWVIEFRRAEEPEGASRWPSKTF